MTNQELRIAVLNLPPAERAELAHDLLASLDEGEDIQSAEWEKLWSDEIARRVREIRDGKAELIDGDEALQRVRARFQNRPK